MKIGIFSPYLDTMSGGEKYILTMSLCLSENNEISLFWDGDKEKIIRRAKSKFNLKIEHLKFTTNIFSDKTPLWKRLKESLKYDLIVFLSDGSIPIVLSKLILHFQTPVEWVKADSLKTKLKILKTSKFICNSAYTKAFIDKKFSVNSEVVYPPVSFMQNEDKYIKENVILNVGRFGINTAGSSFKKQDLMLKIFNTNAKKQFKGWKLHLIVSVDDESSPELLRLKSQAKNSQIELIVNPDNKTLWKEYAKASIYWHASGFGENLDLYPDRAEHFGISTVEAMSQGAVPVVINAGGLKEIVTDGKNGLLWSTEQELISKTNNLITNRKFWNQLSSQAKADSMYFTEENFCRKVKTITE